jgi:probable selenium-dependent hydroxylase accessory protein YqeC
MEYATELGLDEGMTAVIGAGGKKSTMYAVAPTLDRAVVTTAVRIPPFEDQVAEFYETRDPLAAIESAAAWPVGLSPTYEENRYLGYDFDTLGAIADSSIPQAVFVKADGARNRELKVPGEDEPKVPPAADRVLGLASTRVVGKPLTEEYVHRVELVSDLTGTEPGGELTAEAVATVLSSPEGTEQGVPENAEFVPVLNKVDTPALRETAREIADRVLERGRADRVALTQLRGREEPLVELRT